MTKFIVGLLLGLILGIGGTAAFLITAGGGDYLVVTSPRVRELEASLKQADQEREWLRGQLRNSSEMLVKLESRFIGLATRFEDLGSQTATVLGAPPSLDSATAQPASPPHAADRAKTKRAPSPQPTAESTPEPAETAPEAEPTKGTLPAPTPDGSASPGNDSGGHDDNAEPPGDSKPH